MSLSAAGNWGEEAVRDELRKHNGSLIAGFIRSKNICYYGRNFQIDFLLFVPRIGLVVLEVKNWKGTVKATSDDKWERNFYGRSEQFGNASLQALRTSGLLLQILEKGRINKWPIRPLVVFTNENATIMRSNKLPPQTDIVLKSMIPGWLEANGTPEISYKFTADEFLNVKNVICQYTKEYLENA